MKIFTRILLLTGLLLLLGCGGLAFYLYSGRPVYEGQLKLEGLQAETEVYFDQYGIPHIYAKNEEDAYMALGYLHAQERLFQMEMMRRVGEGRLSEVLGKDFLELDQFMRGIGIKAYSEKCANKMMSSNDEPHQKVANAYLKGVNAFIKNGNTPLEFTLLGMPKEEFKAEDIYVAMGYMAFSFAQGFRTDPMLNKIKNKLGESYIKDLAIDYQAGTQKIPVYKPEMKKGKQGDSSKTQKEEKVLASTESKMGGEELIAYMADKILTINPIPVIDGSNSWVLGPQKSSTGKVLFCNDPHIQYAQPSVWYEAHLEYPGVSIYGHFLAGVPFPVIGHNRFCAWGATMLQNDDVNFYKEKINPQNENQYRLSDQWVDFEVREETFKVKGQEEVVLKIRETRNGPLMNDVLENIKGEVSEPISVFWTYTKIQSMVLQMGYDLPRVKSMDEMKKAIAQLHAPGLNIMYGDVQGNIAWWASAKYIKHPKGVNTKFILDANDPKQMPNGYYDFSENPSSVNPPSGYVYSANNQPDTAAGILYQGYYALPDRGKRVVEYLDANQKFGIEDMKKMFLDDIAVSHPQLAGVIIAQSTPETDNEKKAIEILKEWKGEHQLNSIAPVIYNKIHFYIVKNVFLDELGEKDFNLFLKMALMKHTFPKLMNQDGSIWWDDVNSKGQKETRKEIIQKSFKEAIADLEKKMGASPEEWCWSKVHLLTHNHPLGSRGGWLGWIFNVGPFSMIGGNEVLNISSFTLNEEGVYPVVHGASMRILIDFTDVANAENIIPTGQSGNKMSKHYNDQAPLYAKGEFRAMMMDEQKIKDEQHRKLVLKP